MAAQPQNWWESAPLAPAADPGFNGFIPGQPKPQKPEIRQVGNQLGVVDPVTGAFTPTYTAPDKDKDAEGDPQQQLIKDAIGGLGVDELLTGVKRARAKVRGGWATGIPGAIGGVIPGSERNDFKALLDQIQGGIILEKLQTLKEASKTGASGMGALSEREGARLAAAVAALDPNMSAEALETSFQEIERHAKTLQAVRDGLDPRDPAVAAKYGIAPAEDAPPPTADAILPYTAASVGEKGQVTAGPLQLPPDSGGTPPPPPPGRKPNPDEIKFGPDQRAEAEKKEQRDADEFNGRLARGDSIAQLNAWLTQTAGREPLDEETIALINERRQKGVALEFAPNTSAIKKKYEAGLRAEIAAQDKALFSAEGPRQRLMVQGATLGLSDEAAGVGGALSSLVTGGNPTTGYQRARDIERLRIADARAQLGGWGLGIEAVSGLASGNPAAALAPLTAGAVARGGAAGGALAGYGYGEGPEGSLGGAAAGAGLGAAIATGASALGQYVAKPLIERATLRGGRGMAPEVAQAAAAENVSLIRPMVDRRAIPQMGALESNPVSQATIREGVGRVTGEIEGGVARLGRGGRELEPGAAGEVLQLAGNRYVTRSRGVSERLYRRAESQAGGAQFLPENAIRQANEELATLSANPETNRAEMAFIEGLRADLSQPKTVGQLRDLRTSIRGRIGQENLTFTQAEARALRVLEAATNDIERAAPQAAASYRRADAFYRERMVMVDDIKKAILGKRGDPMDPQKAYANIKTLTAPGANGRRLAAIMRHLEPAERNDIAATVAQALGRESADGPFSPALFLSHTKSDKFSPAALRTVFGPDGAQSVANLRVVSRALRDSGGDINRSRSTTVANRDSPWRTAARSFVAGLTGLGGYGVGGTSGAITALTVGAGAMAANAGGKMLSARALMNPRVSRWLARAADVSTEAQAREAARRLGVIIAREPAVAGELIPLHEFLQTRLTQPLAAQPQPEGADNE